MFSNFRARTRLFFYHAFTVLMIMTITGHFWAPETAQAHGSHHIDIVFDLDWTLIYPTNEEMAKVQPENIVRFAGEPFRIADHVIEVLRELHRDPNIRISFFSGGVAERNNIVVNEIYRRINADGSAYAPHLVLHKSHLHVASTDPKHKFAERFKKNLSPYFNLARTILIDDMKDFAIKGQEKNLYWLTPTYNDRPEFHLRHLEKSSDAEYSAPNFEEWEKERKKILVLLEPLLAAVTMNKREPLAFPKLFELAIQKKLVVCRRIHRQN